MAPSETVNWRKIDSWNLPFGSQVVEVPVSLYRAHDGIKLRAYLTGCGDFVYDTDIVKLREQAEHELNQRAGLKLEKFIYVQYGGGSSCPADLMTSKKLAAATVDSLRDGDFEAAMTLEFRIIEVGTRPDGEQCHRWSIGRGCVTKGLPETGPKEDRHGKVNTIMFSLVPYTPETFDALESIRNRMILLNQMLADKLSPASVLKTLESVQAGELLNIS